MLSKPDAAEADLGLGTVIEVTRDGPANGHIGHCTRVLRHKPPITDKPVLRYTQGLSPNIHPSSDENFLFCSFLFVNITVAKGSLRMPGFSLRSYGAP